MFPIDEDRLTTIGHYLTLLEDEDDWLIYIRELNQRHMRKFHHMGVPVQFPCIVVSSIEDDEIFAAYEHKFLYVEAARLLIKSAARLSTRLNLIDQ